MLRISNLKLGIDEDISFLSEVISTSINIALHKNYSMF